MTLAQPHVLILLAVLPVLVLLYLAADRAFQARLHRFLSRRLSSRMTRCFSLGRLRFKRILLLAALALLILAAARPQAGEAIRMVRKRGMNIVFVLDTSRSMATPDVAPNRYARAMHDIEKILEHLGTDRVGLVTFAGEAFPQCPLTTDYAAFRILARAAHLGSIPLPGTNIEKAVAKALETLEAGSKGKGKGAVVLFTDGENHQGDLDAAIAAAKKKSIPVFTIGFGSPAGSPVPDPRGGFKKDREGNIVVSRLDAETLRRLASGTRGRFFLADARGTEVDAVLRALEGFEREEVLSREVSSRAERYQWPLAGALILLACEFCLGVRRR
ncbi:MAG: VWA domain-containing protein [Candidatus Hydrogenedentota bacterium]|nr:MAG: VWA domain-containing protein [Candidatus Hydrogenedentota bacterium]